MAIYDENGSKITANLPNRHFMWKRILSALVIFSCAMILTYGLAGQDSRKEIREDLTGYLGDVKKLTIINEGHNMSFVRYAKFDDMDYSTMERKVKPKFTKNDDGTEVTMRFDNSAGRMVSFSVHGPSLETIEIKGVVDVELYNGGNSINIINEGVTLDLVSGADKVSLTNGQSSTIRLDKASIEELEIRRNDGLITASSITSLKVNAAHECVDRPHWAYQTTMIRSVASGKMTFEGVEQAVGNLVDDCGRQFIIGPTTQESQ